MPLSDKEKEMLDELGGLLSGLLESGKGSVSDKDFGLLSVVPNTLRDSNYYEGTGMKDMGYHPKNLVEDTSPSLGGAITEREMQHFMSTLSHPVRTRLNEIRGAVSDVDFQSFMRQYMAGQIPEGALFEPLPNTQQGANLGFTAPEQYAQGSQFYNENLGTFMPSSYQGGYTGATGDERYKQGGADWGFSSYPHGSDRNYYGEKMMNPRYVPLKLG